MSASIPKIIHQMWIGPNPAPSEIMSTWRELHPDWEYRLWDNAAVASRTFLNQHHIDEMREWSGKCDIMRYEILFEQGGIFLDADSVCLRGLDEAFLKNDSFAAWEQERLRPGLIAAGTMGMTPHCELMGLVIEELLGTEQLRGPAWQTVGPGLLTRTVEKFQYDRITVYPSHFFYPIHYSGLRYRGSDKPYSNQFWGSTTTHLGRSYEALESVIDIPTQLLKSARSRLLPEQSLVLYDALCEETDRDSDFHRMGILGASNALQQLGRTEEAVVRFERARVTTAETELLVSLAMLYGSTNRIALAIGLLRSARSCEVWPERTPEFTITREQAVGALAKYCLEISAIEFQHAEYDVCIEAAHAALEADPTSAEAWSNICAAKNMLGTCEEARAAGERAIALNPDFETARANLAWSIRLCEEARRSIVTVASRIPKILHQIWIGPHPAPVELMQTWKDKHPDWEYRFWGNDELSSRRFRNERHIDSIEMYSGKTNVMRYEILLEQGGIYLDADGECLRPLDNFFLENDSFACWEHERLMPELIANGTLGTVPDNRLMRYMVAVLDATPEVTGPSWISTGPVFLTESIRKLNYDPITIYPSHYFYPMHHSGARYRGPDRPYAYQYWGTTHGSYEAGCTSNDDVLARMLKTAREWGKSATPEKAFPFYEVLSEEPGLTPDQLCIALLGAAYAVRFSSPRSTRVELLRRAVEASPHRLEPVASLAHLLLEDGNPIAALPFLRIAFSEIEWPAPSPEFPVTRALLAREARTWLLDLSAKAFEDERYFDCVIAAKTALDYESNSAEAWSNISAAYNMLDKPHEGKNAAEAALRLQPDLTIAHANLGWSRRLLAAS